jgi:hypothetical protein
MVGCVHDKSVSPGTKSYQLIALTPRHCKGPSDKNQMRSRLSCTYLQSNRVQRRVVCQPRTGAERSRVLYVSANWTYLSHMERNRGWLFPASDGEEGSSLSAPFSPSRTPLPKSAYPPISKDQRANKRACQSTCVYVVVTRIRERNSMYPRV